jgi:CubicO group peptidase (beta-lactamase class C family)
MTTALRAVGAAALMFLLPTAACAQHDVQERVERGLLPTIALRGRRDTAYTIGERLRRYDVPGVCIAVIDKGRLSWTRCYGVTDAATLQHVDTATLFQAGSISKAVTAVVAMRLVEDGILRLDDDVNGRLVSWKLPPSALAPEGAVTLRRLLSHGAGLNVPSFPGYAPGDPTPSLRQVLDGVPPANTPAVRVEVAPGTEWRYSGGGFTIIQQLVVDASGSAFPALLERRVLGPAAMAGSTFEQPLSPARALHAATGHSGGAPLPGRWRVYPELAAAGLWATASDLARFGIAVLRSWRGESGALLGRATAREMLSRQRGDWGLGFALGGGETDSASFGHDGSTAGFTARLLVLSARAQGIAVMTNGESEALIDEITRSVAREYHWPVRPRREKVVATVDPAGYAALAGRYRVDLGERAVDFSVTVDGNRLLIARTSGRASELLPESDLGFFSQDSGTEFTFTRDGAGRVTTMIIDQQGQRFTAHRLP